MNKLPADPLSLILGILALIIGIAGCCCYGFTVIVPLIMSIIGLVVANKSIREFNNNPEAYDPQSRNNVSTAKIINIIAIVLNSLILLLLCAALIIYGTILSSAIFGGINNINFEDDDFYYDTEIETEIDTTNTWTDEDYIIEEEMDSINMDSMYEKEPELKKTFIERESI